MDELKDKLDAEAMEPQMDDPARTEPADEAAPNRLNCPNCPHCPHCPNEENLRPAVPIANPDCAVCDPASEEEVAEEMEIPAEELQKLMETDQETDQETSIEEDEAAKRALMRAQLIEGLKTLTPREAMVLKLRFGLEDGRLRTLEEAAQECNITRERILQIEAKLLRRMGVCLFHRHRKQKESTD